MSPNTGNTRRCKYIHTSLLCAGEGGVNLL
jgi:hypothetical protein